MSSRNERLVWMDLEMTGLDIDKESIIEIATVITDQDLNIIAEGPNLRYLCQRIYSRKWMNGILNIIMNLA